MEPLRQPSNIEIDGAVTPIRNRVIVRKIEQSPSPVFWTPVQDEAVIGEVVAVGKPMRTEKGVELPQEFSVGDQVVFSKHVGVELVWQGHPALMMREDEVLGVVREKNGSQ